MRLGVLKGILSVMLVLFGACVMAQEKEDVRVVDDEACGCELFYVDGIQTTQQDGRFGFKKADGTVIVPNKYMFVDRFHDGYCIVFADYYQAGLIDRNGREIVPCEYEEVVYPSEGLIRVKKNGFFGFIDTAGRMAIAPRFYSASGFFEGLAVAAMADIDGETLLFGYIDTAGNWVIAPRYQYACPFTEGWAVIKAYDRYGMIDRAGKEVVAVKYGEVSMLTDGRFFAEDANTGMSALFSKRRRLTDFVYERVVGYSEGLYLVVRNGLYGFLDSRGNEVIPCRYTMANPMKDGFAMVSDGTHYGIVDRRGRMLLPMTYDNSGFRSEAYTFYEGLALVEQAGKYGYVNKQGQIVIPLKYSSGYKFTEGIAPVCDKGSWGYIDHEGMTAISFVFTVASPFEYGRAEVVFGGEVYKIDTKGRCVKNCHGIKFF